VLLAAAGMASRLIAGLGICEDTAREWRRLFLIFTSTPSSLGLFQASLQQGRDAACIRSDERQPARPSPGEAMQEAGFVMVRAHGLGRVVSGAGRRRRHRLGMGTAAAVLTGAGLVALSGGAADAATLAVCAQGCAYTQIQPAVDAASPGDTILVGPGTYAGGIVIATALTLSGAGAGATVISGGGPVISVSASPVTIRGVSLTGGSAPADGGGILNTGTLTVQDATVAHNTAGGNGGGIANDGSASPVGPPASLTLRQVTITGNESSTDGGGIYNAFRTATAQVSGSTIRGNTTALEGGGVANEAHATLTLTSDAVSANSAGDEGGGIADLDFAPATVSGTTVDRNTAAGGGGGISVAEGGSLTMANGEINGNSAPGEPGGGVSVDGVYQHENSTATITGTSINGNAADTGGGVELSLAVVTLTNDAVNANTATTAGGGIANDPDAQLTLGDTSVTHNTTAGDGGGISNVAAAALTNDSVNANTAAGNGGGVYNGTGQIGLVQVTGTMTLNPNTSVSRNQAAAGGGIYVAAGAVTLNGATVTGNIPDNCQPAGC
jgi:putative cofactor-binding repeat protein